MLAVLFLKRGVDIWAVCEDDQDHFLLKESMCQFADRKPEIIDAPLCKGRVEVALFIVILLREKSSKEQVT